MTNEIPCRGVGLAVSNEREFDVLSDAVFPQAYLAINAAYCVRLTADAAGNYQNEDGCMATNVKSVDMQTRAIASWENSELSETKYDTREGKDADNQTGRPGRVSLNWRARCKGKSDLAPWKGAHEVGSVGTRTPATQR